MNESMRSELLDKHAEVHATAQIQDTEGTPAAAAAAGKVTVTSKKMGWKDSMTSKDTAADTQVLPLGVEGVSFCTVLRYNVTM
jgi:3D (Asp-Asp-Asp) domain-containing protein